MFFFKICLKCFQGNIEAFLSLLGSIMPPKNNPTPIKRLESSSMTHEEEELQYEISKLWYHVQKIWILQREIKDDIDGLKEKIKAKSDDLKDQTKANMDDKVEEDHIKHQ